MKHVRPPLDLMRLGHSYYLQGRYEEAIGALRKALARNPNFFPAHTMLAASYVRAGEAEAARLEVEEIRRISPDFSPSTGGRPRRVPCARALASPAWMRSRIMARSNSANTPII